MASNLKVVICDTAEDVAKKCAGIFVNQVRNKPDSVLGFATGSTPMKSYAQMAELSKAENVSWQKVVTFNLDEYWGLDGDHDQSYRYFMNTELFQKIDINPWNTNVLNGKAKFPEVECRAYEEKIISVGGVDLWLLGIGGNGHIAFNEPGSPVDSRTRLVSLTQSTIDANSDGRFFSDPADVPRCALSTGIGTCRDARQVVLLATGSGKADAIAAALEGPFSPDCPASLLQDHPDCTFILDKESASKLKNK